MWCWASVGWLMCCSAGRLLAASAYLGQFRRAQTLISSAAASLTFPGITAAGPPASFLTTWRLPRRQLRGRLRAQPDAATQTSTAELSAGNRSSQAASAATAERPHEGTGARGLRARSGAVRGAPARGGCAVVLHTGNGCCHHHQPHGTWSGPVWAYVPARTSGRHTLSRPRMRRLLTHWSPPGGVRPGRPADRGGACGRGPAGRVRRRSLDP